MFIWITFIFFRFIRNIKINFTSVSEIINIVDKNTDVTIFQLLIQLFPLRRNFNSLNVNFIAFLVSNPSSLHCFDSIDPL